VDSNQIWKFGRRHSSNAERPDKYGYFVGEDLMAPPFLKVLSTEHFMIEKKKSGVNADVSKYSPAYLTVLSMNGLFVNDIQLQQHDQRILVNGDLLKLTQSIQLFEFSYIEIQPISESEVAEKLGQNFHIGEFLGSGASATVRKLYNASTMEAAALKIFIRVKKSLAEATNDYTDLNEVKIMLQCNHKNILTLFSSYHASDCTFLITELMASDLMTRIGESPDKRFSEKDTKFFMYQICCGVNYLHSKGIVHRDIKPENMLLSDKGPSPLLKLADLGLSKETMDYMMTKCGTRYYAGK